LIDLNFNISSVKTNLELSVVLVKGSIELTLVLLVARHHQMV
jgi:hypothetical protein